jgi:hypothetical protein
MRTTALLFALALSTLAPAQDFERIEVVNMDSTRSAADLYAKAERWFVDAFRSANDVIQLKDTATRTIVGRGSFEVPYEMKGLVRVSMTVRVNFAMEFSAKDGRYRTKIYQMTADDKPMRNQQCCFGECDGGGNAFRQASYQCCADIHKNFDKMIAGLRASMDQNPQADW